MKQFIETICILDGVPRHLEWHQRRVDATLAHFYPAHQHTWNLAEAIEIPEDHHTGKVKCTVRYDAHLFSVFSTPYQYRQVSTLKLVAVEKGFGYDFKYADRSGIESLFDAKGDADDILMTKEGWIKDSSKANIAFENDGRWYTPAIPLLAGTTWKRLISFGILTPTPIHHQDLVRFQNFKLFNALNTFEDAPPHPVRNIS